MSGRFRGSDSRGFTMIELIVAFALIGILSAAAVPSFLTYWQSAALKAGAEELAVILNKGRQLAINTNNFVCVEQSANLVRFRPSNAATCTGTPWMGGGTDGNGWLRLDNALQVSVVTANVIFTHMGAAAPSGTYTVRNPVNAKTLSVIVAGSGRVTIGP